MRCRLPNKSCAAPPTAKAARVGAYTLCRAPVTAACRSPRLFAAELPVQRHTLILPRCGSVWWAGRPSPQWLIVYVDAWAPMKQFAIAVAARLGLMVNAGVFVYHFVPSSSAQHAGGVEERSDYGLQLRHQRALSDPTPRPHAPNVIATSLQVPSRCSQLPPFCHTWQSLHRAMVERATLVYWLAVLPVP
jgi:hypothetical protein